METEVFVLCDAATDSQGKLNMLGVFDTIFSASLPAIHTQCAIAARIRFSTNEGGEHPFRITLTDNLSNNLIPPFEGRIQVEIKRPDQPSRINIIISLAGLKFESFGTYMIRLEVDGSLLASNSFIVIEPVSAMSTAAQ